MSAHLFSMALAATLGAGPYGYEVAPGYSGSGYPGPGYGTPMMHGGGYGDGGYGDGGYGGGGYGGGGDQLYPYDQQDPWQHGYFQVMPAYGGYGHFLPYNYKHVLSQSQTAGGWGMSPNMPYSQQFWHRYQPHATLRKIPPTRDYSRYGNDPYRPQIDRGLPSPLPNSPGNGRPPTIAPQYNRGGPAAVAPGFQGNRLSIRPR